MNEKPMTKGAAWTKLSSSASAYHPAAGDAISRMMSSIERW
ncbi:hypothetical protein OKW45_001747 [Paraburkholderia sp. WSM4175]